MFKRQELATLAAALRFWRDEMLPQDPDIVGPYFEGLTDEPPSDQEVEALLTRIESMASGDGTNSSAS